MRFFRGVVGVGVVHHNGETGVKRTVDDLETTRHLIQVLRGFNDLVHREASSKPGA